MFGNYLGCRRFQKRWVSLYAFCEPHRSAIGTVIAVGAVMEIPALPNLRVARRICFCRLGRAGMAKHTQFIASDLCVEVVW